MMSNGRTIEKHALIQLSFLDFLMYLGTLTWAVKHIAYTIIRNSTL